MLGSSVSKIVEAKVKKEFLVSQSPLSSNTTNDFDPFNNTSNSNLKRKFESVDVTLNPSESLDIPDIHKPSDCKTKNERKQFRGQNKPKNRPRDHVKDTIQLCTSIALGKTCNLESCRFSHDVESYLSSKQPDLPGPCPNIQEHGCCHFGLRCHFLNAHPKPTDSSKSELNDFSESVQPPGSGLTKEAQRAIRKKEISFERTHFFLTHKTMLSSNVSDENGSDLTPLTKREKAAQKLNVQGLTYLAPLTTVGNLPFRRLCKQYGVDITCGEMALSSQLLNGKFSEWALTKRHPSETIFGVQIAGSKTEQLLNACELLREYGDFDFIDFNLGCPIDSVFGSGCGSALLDRTNKVRDLVSGMLSVVDCPVTVKIRTGVHVDKNVAHELIPMFSDLGVSLTTIHGRSRQQRYRSIADWEYIQFCSKQKKNGMQVFGNGDIFHPQQYYDFLEQCPTLDGIMIGRGALIKPWIFREIKERKLLDISSKERLDMLHQFTQYGLAHWGTDTQGLELARRFLLEFQSFHHRYIPVGLLDSPQYLNQRLPRFYGRDSMETLLGSPYVGDWIKLSELFLGPAPQGFKFVPKHKANSDESKAIQ